MDKTMVNSIEVKTRTDLIEEWQKALNWAIEGGRFRQDLCFEEHEECSPYNVGYTVYNCSTPKIQGNVVLALSNQALEEALAGKAISDTPGLYNIDFDRRNDYSGDMCEMGSVDFYNTPESILEAATHIVNRLYPNKK